MAKIFISYRHLGGAAMGQLLCDRLKAKRHSVFFDRDSLVAGKYPEKILEAIENCDCVLLILPENALDRSVSDPEDWVRREIRHALNREKPVIPVFLRGFVFPEELPEDIREIKDYHGISFEKMECFEETVDKLCRMLPLTGLRKGLHSVGRVFGKLSRTIGKILEAFWRWKFVRCAILFFLGFMVLAYGIDIIKYINNSYVEQWIRPMTLYRENAYTLNVPISPDNRRMAVYDGNGQIFLSKVEGNTADSDDLGVLETSFAGKPALVGFQGSKYCCVVCEGDLEIFDLDRSAKPIHKLHFGDYDPDYYVQNLIWGEDFSGFATLWAEKETGTISHCTVYDGALSGLATFELKACRYLGSADDGRYLLLWDEDTQAIRIIDRQSRTEGTLKTMGEACYERIDQTSDSYWNFDENGRYVLCYYPSWNDPYQNRVAVVDLKTGEEVYSGDYRITGQASFDSGDSFLIYHATKDQKMELRRVRFLEKNDAYEVLLTEDDLARMLEGEPNPEEFYGNMYDFYIFRGSNYMLAAYEQRLHLINMETKRRTACCNPLEVDSNYITGYRFLETNDNIITVILSADTVPGDTFDYDWSNTQKQTAVRFSFENVDGRIVIHEDGYAGDLLFVSELFWLLLGVAGLICFLRVGYRVKKRAQFDNCCA